MNRFVTKLRVTFAVVLLFITTLIGAAMLKLIPDERHSILESRSRFCEGIAVTTSVLLSKDEMEQEKAYMQRMVDRYDDVLSAAVRRADGGLLIEVGDHVAHWIALKDKYSTETQVHVPIYKGQQNWGEIEVRFRPLSEPGWRGVLANPWVRLVIFVAVIGHLLCWLGLDRFLEPLERTDKEPNGAMSAQSSLGDGVLVTDNQGMVVLADAAFGYWVGKKPGQLIGCRAAQFPWWSLGVKQAEEYPWVRAVAEQKLQFCCLMKLGKNETNRRTLLVNSVPILGHDGSCGGAISCFLDVTRLPKDDAEEDEPTEADSEAIASATPG